MGSSCCDMKSSELEKLNKQQSQTLWVVLTINLVMFGVEIVASLHANSLSLMGDSLDMLGDSAAYATSIYAVNRGSVVKAQAAMFKGWIVLGSAIFVLGAAVYRSYFLETPLFEVMGVIGALALVANLVCLMLLTRFRNTDINMQSVWLCSRNDIIANVSVLAATGLVFLTESPWPDLIIGAALAILFAKSAMQIFVGARKELSVSRGLSHG